LAGRPIGSGEKVVVKREIQLGVGHCKLKPDFSPCDKAAAVLGEQCKQKYLLLLASR